MKGNIENDYFPTIGFFSSHTSLEVGSYRGPYLVLGIIKAYEDLLEPYKRFYDLTDVYPPF